MLPPMSTGSAGPASPTAEAAPTGGCANIDAAADLPACSATSSEGLPPLPDRPASSAADCGIPHLHSFLLETSVVLNYPARPSRRTDAGSLSSVRAAWSDFLGLGAAAAPAAAPAAPPPPRLATAALPAAALSDEAVGMLFAYPSARVAPARLAAFALPSSVVLLDAAGQLPPPKVVQFCTTAGDGSLTWGCALQVVEAAGPPEDCAQVEGMAPRDAPASGAPPSAQSGDAAATGTARAGTAAAEAAAAEAAGLEAAAEAAGLEAAALGASQAPSPAADKAAPGQAGAAPAVGGATVAAGAVGAGAAAAVNATTTVTAAAAVNAVAAVNAAVAAASAPIGSSATADVPALRQRLSVRSLVLLSHFPMLELQKTILKHVLTHREMLWPATPADAESGGGGTLPVGAEGEGGDSQPGGARGSAEGGAGKGVEDRAAAARAARLAALFRQIECEMRASQAELAWLLAHPLWLPVPLAPLCRALRWDASHVSCLLMAVLTDHKVLLHSREPQLAFLAAAALRCLVAPLEYSGVFIPLLPPPLMPPEDAATLLFDCSTPYLIGCETLLLRRLGAAADPSPAQQHRPADPSLPPAQPQQATGNAERTGGSRGQHATARQPGHSTAHADPPAALPPLPSAPLQPSALPQTLTPPQPAAAPPPPTPPATAASVASAAASVSARAASVSDLFVVDLDRGLVHPAAAARRWLNPRAPPLASLSAELNTCMGDTTRFRQAGVQAACLRFLVDTLNLSNGFLASSRSPADTAALTHWRLTRAFAAEVDSRCRASGMPPSGLEQLRQAQAQAEGANLAAMCDAALASAPPGHDLLPWGGLLGEAAASVADGAGGAAPAVRQLRHVYASQSFRSWWLRPSRGRAPERLQWMEFRAKGIDLAEYLRENRDSLAVLEGSVAARVQGVLEEAVKGVGSGTGEE